MKNYTAALIALILLGISVITGGCDMLAQDKDEGEDVLYVYSWGDYLDPDVLVQFEQFEAVDQHPAVEFLVGQRLVGGDGGAHEGSP